MPDSQKPQAEPKFDLVVHERDKYGKLVEVKPYRMHAISGVQYFERPVGSGNLFFLNNEKAGRLVAGKVEKSADHVAYTPPQTQDQKVAMQLTELEVKNAELARELEALRAEREAKVPEKKDKK